jgi:exosortase
MGVLLALAIAWLYAETLAGLGREWLSSPDASYGVVLVAVAAAVAWQRRDRAARACAAPPTHRRAGAFILGASLLLFLAGQLGADVFLTRLSLVAVVTGTLWFVAGGAVVRVLAAPLAFMLMAVPLPALIVNAVTLPLQFTASQIAESTLTTAGVAVFRDGNVLELPSATLQVAEACSGLRSLVSLTAIAVLLAWATPGQSRLARVAMVAAAVPVAIVMNGFRIAGIGLACEAWGPRMASGAWHTFSGWLTFAASAVVLIAIQRIIAPDRAAPPAIEGAAAA